MLCTISCDSSSAMRFQVIKHLNPAPHRLLSTTLSDLPRKSFYSSFVAVVAPRQARLFTTKTLTTARAQLPDNTQLSRSNPPSIAGGKHFRSRESQQTSSLSTMASPDYANPVDFYREYIAERLAPLVERQPSEIYPLLSWTTTLDKGDLILPAAALRIKGKKPQDIAADVVSKFPADDSTAVTIEAQGAFLAFFFKPTELIKRVVPQILSQKEAYGPNTSLGLLDPKDPSKGQKKVIVEFSSPNIAKEFHQGHLRSTIIGGFLSKLFAKTGWEVIRMNYLGDWGKQYGLLANGFRKFGNDEELEKDSIQHLFKVYVQISKIQKDQNEPIDELKKEILEKRKAGADVTDLETKLAPLVDASEDEAARKYFKSMEDGDPEAVALWNRFRDMSIAKYKKTYERLNIEFDVFSGESQVGKEMMDTVLTDLKKQGIAEVDQGATLIDFSKHGAKKLNKAIIIRKDGTPLYLTRDLAAILERHEKFHFDKMVYVIADQQNEHVAQLFKTTDISGHKDVADKCEHVSFGMVKGMSTRKGTVKFLDDVIAAVREVMWDVMRKNEKKYEQLENPEAIADILAISAIMVQDLKGKIRNGYEFNIDQMTAFEGDTGPYLQYAHARLCSIERKAGVDSSTLSSADLSKLSESHAVNLVRALAQWPDVVTNTVKTQEPATVLTYLFKMAHALSSSYDHLQVVGSEPELQKARLALYEAARQVLWNGMTLLGLSPLDRM